MKGVHSVCLQQNAVQLTGDTLSPTAVISHVQRKAAPLRNSTSSSEVDTSSASNRSFAFSEQNDDENSEASSPKRANKKFEESTTFGTRFFNKLLTETSIKLIEMRYPSMTTRDRVIYWKLSDEFSDIEDDLDQEDSQKKPFLSERVGNAISPNPVENNKNQSFSQLQTRKAYVHKTHGNRSSEGKRRSSGLKGAKTPSEISISPNGLPSPNKEKANGLSTTLLRLHAVAKSNEEVPSSIKLRIDYTKKSSSAASSVNNGVDRNGDFKVPITPLTKGGTGNHEQQAEGLAKASECDEKASNSSNEVAEISKVRNTQEEFYKYLGIDTNPPQEKHSPASTSDTTSTNQMRRSLRVKIQQNIVNSLSRSAEKLKESEKPKMDDPKANMLSKSTSTASNATSVSPQQEEKHLRRLSGTKRRLEMSSTGENQKCRRESEPLERLEEQPTTSSGLVKVTYIKNEKVKSFAAPAKEYKSINLAERTPAFLEPEKETLNGTQQMPNESPEARTHVFERKSYEMTSSNEHPTAERSIVYKAKVMVSASSSQSMPHTPKETEKPASKMEQTNPPNEAEKLPKQTERVQSSADAEAKPPGDESKARRQAAKKAINFSEIFRRYKRCLRQGVVLKSRLRRKWPKRRPNSGVDRRARAQNNASVVSVALETSPGAPSISEVRIIDGQPNGVSIEVKEESAEGAQQQMPSSSSELKNRFLSPPYEDFTFSPTSITHSNSSTDSAIVVSNACEGATVFPPSVFDRAATKVVQSQTQIAKPISSTPFGSECVEAIITPSDPSRQCLVVVQESSVSFWRVAPRYLNIFGQPQAWQCIGHVKRRTIGI